MRYSYLVRWFLSTTYFFRCLVAMYCAWFFVLFCFYLRSRNSLLGWEQGQGGIYKTVALISTQNIQNRTFFFYIYKKERDNSCISKIHDIIIVTMIIITALAGCFFFFLSIQMRNTFEKSLSLSLREARQYSFDHSQPVGLNSCS